MQFELSDDELESVRAALRFALDMNRMYYVFDPEITGAQPNYLEPSYVRSDGEEDYRLAQIAQELLRRLDEGRRIVTIKD